MNVCWTEENGGGSSNNIGMRSNESEKYCIRMVNILVK
jgi:hypothetical protein